MFFDKVHTEHFYIIVSFDSWFHGSSDVKILQSIIKINIKIWVPLLTEIEITFPSIILLFHMVCVIALRQIWSQNTK